MSFCIAIGKKGNIAVFRKAQCDLTPVIIRKIVKNLLAFICCARMIYILHAYTSNRPIKFLETIHSYLETRHQGIDLMKLLSDKRKILRGKTYFFTW